MISDKPYKPTIYRGYNLYYMGKGRVQVLDERGLVFRKLSLALDWIDGDVNI
jgi:hypothetical protein